MTTTTTGQRYPLVFLIFNSIFNLLTQDSQVECFRSAARHLGDDGLFLVEAALPAELDPMARLAGLLLRDRWGGWRREPSPPTASATSRRTATTRRADGKQTPAAAKSPWSARSAGPTNSQRIAGTARMHKF